MLALKKYFKAFELGFESALEYRMNFLLSLVSAAYPIIIQTFLWSAIYRNATEEVVYGYTFEQMLAYTFLAGLVSRLVRTGFEYEIMDDVKTGKFSKFLVQPMGYFPFRVFSFFGNKIPGQGMILIILSVIIAVLSAIGFMHLELIRVLAFIVTVIFATALNFIIFYSISAMSFWIVEVGFLFEGIRITFVLLSGGIFPLEVFGERFVQVMNFLPFKYTVSYPINVLTGRLSLAETSQGILIQLLWIVICWGIAAVLWRIGSRRYVAVGG